MGISEVEHEVGPQERKPGSWTTSKWKCRTKKLYREDESLGLPENLVIQNHFSCGKNKQTDKQTNKKNPENLAAISSWTKTVMRNDTRRAGHPKPPFYTHSTKIRMFYFIYLRIRKKSKILNITPKLSTLLKGPHSQLSLRRPRSDDCLQFFEPAQPPDRTGSDRWAPVGHCRSFLQPAREVGACFLYPRRTLRRPYPSSRVRGSQSPKLWSAIGMTQIFPSGVSTWSPEAPSTVWSWPPACILLLGKERSNLYCLVQKQ